MAEREFEVRLIRYIPNIITGEFVNIGVVLSVRQGKEMVRGEVRFRTDWGRVVCFDPDLDIEMLAEFIKHVRQQFGTELEWRNLLEEMENTFSNLIQITTLEGIDFSISVPAIEALAKDYLVPYRTSES